MSVPQPSDSLSPIIISIRQELAHCLKRAPEEVDINLSFAEMGADSLILMDVLQEINRRYEVTLPVMDLYESLDTIAKVAQYLHQQGRSLSVDAGRAAAVSVASDPPLPAFAEERGPELGDHGPGGPLSGDRRHVLGLVIQRQLELMGQQLQLFSAREPGLPAPRAARPARPVERPAVAVARVVEWVPARTSPEASSTAACVMGSEPRSADRFSAFGVRLERDERERDRGKMEQIADLAQRLNAKTQKSKDHVQQYRRVLADNRASAGFRPLLKQMVYPIIAERAQGAHVFDIDGNRYLDFTMGFGAHLFGHSPAFIVDALKAQIERGIPIGPQSPLAGKVAARICELTGHSRVTFCNSGTEATMTALRLARAKTGRARIAVFKNSYHGTFDGLLARTGASSDVSRPASLGTPDSMVQDTVVLEYCDPSAFDYIEKHSRELAAVLVEPIQSRAPSAQPGAFLQELAALTRKHGIALIFDEVITGFRCAPGGAQELFGVRADLCAYGKVLGGGMPIGVVAGNSDYMDGIDGGYWSYTDDSQPTRPSIFFAGTFSKHPLAMAASLAVLEQIQARGEGLYSALATSTEELCRRLNAVFTAHGADLRAEHFGSLFRFASKANLDLFYYQLLLAGYFIWEGRNCFLSTEHRPEDLDGFVAAVDGICGLLFGAHPAIVPAVAVGSESPWVTPRSAEGRGKNPETLRLADAQQRFGALSRTSQDGNIACNVCFALRFVEAIDAERLANAVSRVLSDEEVLWHRIDLEQRTQQPTLRRDRRTDSGLIRLDGSTEDAGLIERLLAEQQKEPLDPASGFGARARVFAFSGGAALLTLCVHHLVCDGWGLVLLFERIANAYEQQPRLHGAGLHAADATPSAEGREATADVGVAYLSWLQHEAEYERTSRYAADRQFWETKLNEIVVYQQAASFVGVQHRSGVGARRGRRARWSSGEGLAKALRARAHADSVTPFTALLSGFQVFLNRVYRHRLPVIGIPFANRPTREFKQLVASCVNLLPLLPVHGDTVTHAMALGWTKKRLPQLFDHAAFPYQAMCEAYAARAGQRDVAPVEVTFNVEPITRTPRFGGTVPKIEAASNDRIEFDLMVNVFMLESEIQIELDYAAELIPEVTARGWLNFLGKIFENYATASGVAGPSAGVKPRHASASVERVS